MSFLLEERKDSLTESLDSIKHVRSDRIAQGREQVTGAAAGLVHSSHDSHVLSRTGALGPDDAHSDKHTIYKQVP